MATDRLWILDTDTDTGVKIARRGELWSSDFDAGLLELFFEINSCGPYKLVTESDFYTYGKITKDGFRRLFLSKGDYEEYKIEHLQKGESMPNGGVSNDDHMARPEKMIVLNLELVGRLIGSPDGIYGEELAGITSDYREQIRALDELGAEFEYSQDPAGKKFCKLTNPERVREIITERAAEPEDSPHNSGDDAQPLAPPPSSSPPAETPAGEEVSVSVESVPGLKPKHQGHFIARSIRVDARKITLAPAEKFDAQMALGFAMDVPQGARIHVYMDIIEEPVQDEPESPPEEGDEMPKDPEDMKTVQTIVKPPNEKDPAKKSKSQLYKELSEQVQKGEISTTLADSTSKMADL